MHLLPSSPHSLLPREKLQHLGTEYLTTTELLHLILGSGSAHAHIDKLAVQLSKKLNIPQRKLELADLLSIKGIGLAKACQFLAAIELVERLRPQGLPLVTCFQEVLAQVYELRSAQQEQLICLYLNGRQQLLLKEIVAIGGLNRLSLLPRDIFRPIKYLPVLSLIVVHNHPSGDPTPSSDDVAWTQRLSQSCELLGLKLVDHIIVTKEKEYSFREDGQLGDMGDS